MRGQGMRGCVSHEGVCVMIRYVMRGCVGRDMVGLRGVCPTLATGGANNETNARVAVGLDRLFFQRTNLPDGKEIR